MNEDKTIPKEWPTIKLIDEIEDLRARYTKADVDLMITRIHDSETKLAAMTETAKKLREKLYLYWINNDYRSVPGVNQLIDDTVELAEEGTAPKGQGGE